MNNNFSLSDSTLKRRSQFRRTGWVILLLGLLSAFALYRIRTSSTNVQEDPMLTGYSKPETRQMAILYGRMGLMSSDLFENLKRPGVQAILIACFSVLVALGCLYLSRRWVEGD